MRLGSNPDDWTGDSQQPSTKRSMRDSLCRFREAADRQSQGGQRRLYESDLTGHFGLHSSCGSVRIECGVHLCNAIARFNNPSIHFYHLVLPMGQGCLFHRPSCFRNCDPPLENTRKHTLPSSARHGVSRLDRIPSITPFPARNSTSYIREASCATSLQTSSSPL